MRIDSVSDPVYAPNSKGGPAADYPGQAEPQCPPHRRADGGGVGPVPCGAQVLVGAGEPAVAVARPITGPGPAEGIDDTARAGECRRDHPYGGERGAMAVGLRGTTLERGERAGIVGKADEHEAVGQVAEQEVVLTQPRIRHRGAGHGRLRSVAQGPERGDRGARARRGASVG